MKLYFINIFLIALFASCSVIEEPPTHSETTVIEKSPFKYYYICNEMSETKSSKLFKKGFRFHPSTPEESRWVKSKDGWDTFASICVKVSINDSSL
jgi:hypothetical protein|tara:strand:- start:25 stop:312 length:288 start_codon:yes stop_codon:yes gene_type:complete